MSHELPAQYQAAAALEEHLGDPREAGSALSFASAVALDESESFPTPHVDALVRWGYLRRMVPQANGGLLGSLEEGAALQRAVSRRDLTAAIALGQSFLGSVPVWLGGSDAQKMRQAELLLSGQLAALALTEEAHGADVLASEVSARKTEGGYLLSGAKWLINNATRGAALTVFARTSEEGGLHGCSLFVVDKGRLPGATLLPLPKFKTHGIRGADISGLRFVDTPLPSSMLLGEEGTGAGRVLQALQLTRAGCAAFSLGAADTGLRLALDFARGRVLYGATAFDIPHARSLLVNGFLDLLICECVSLAALRGAQAAPGQLSLWSQVAKYFVPVTCEKILREASVVLGARHYLRQGHADGAFQKLLRDAAVVSLFDGSTAVNLDGVGTQLVRLSPDRAASDDERAQTLAGVFDLGAALPPLFAAPLELMTAGRDDVTQGVEQSIARLARLRDRPLDGAALPLEPELLDRLLALAQELSLRLGELGRHAAVIARDRSLLKRSPELFELAARYCSLFAGASCLHLFVHSRSRLDAWGARGVWLALCLERLLGPFGAAQIPRRSELIEEAVTRLLRLHDEERAFALVALPLGRTSR